MLYISLRKYKIPRVEETKKNKIVLKKKNHEKRLYYSNKIK